MLNRVLVVSDSRDIVDRLTSAFEMDGFEVVAADNGLDGIKRIYDTHPSILIIEDHLSSAATFDICSHASELSCLPVILIGEAVSEVQVIEGLDRGADFYMAKPVCIPELVARSRALLRRWPGWPDEVCRFLDADRHTAYVGGRWITLTATEFRLLSYMVMNKGRIIPTEELLTQVWSREELSFYVCRLRQKLNHSTPHNIHTHYGMGYRLATWGDVQGSLWETRAGDLEPVE